MSTRKENYVLRKNMFTNIQWPPPLIEASKDYTMLRRESRGHKIGFNMKTKYFQPHSTEK